MECDWILFVWYKDEDKQQFDFERITQEEVVRRSKQIIESTWKERQKAFPFTPESVPEVKLFMEVNNFMELLEKIW